MKNTRYLLWEDTKRGKGAMSKPFKPWAMQVDNYIPTEYYTQFFLSDIYFFLTNLQEGPTMDF